MAISNSRAYYGLVTTATPLGSGTIGNLLLGTPSVSLPLINADVAYSMSAVLADVDDALVLDVDDNTTSASTPFTPGVAQVETATASGSITGSGNATITVTASGMVGSPKAISVGVLSGDSASVWAGRVRTALQADTAVAALFSVSGTGTSIQLTRKARATFTDPALSLYSANDDTLNIAIANGTCTGITPSSTSENTTAGVASTGAKVFDGDGKDFEGTTLATIGTLQGFLITCTSGEVEMTSTSESAIISSGEARLIANVNGLESLLDTLTFTASADNSVVKITAIGTVA